MAEADNYIVAEESSFWHYLTSLLIRRKKAPTLEFSSSLRQQGQELGWREKLTLFILRFMRVISKVLKPIGRCLDAYLNILNTNGGFLRVACKFLLRKELRRPDKNSVDHLSINGHLDPRVDLYMDIVDGIDLRFPQSRVDSKITADVCVMASKLAYENAAVIKKVVTESWKMHFIEAYDCWNDFQQQLSTQLFLFADSEQDPQALVIAFRGTEPFDAYDWCTDFDFSWCRLAGMGQVHVGFLEALGLGDRTDMQTFQKMKANIFERTRTLPNTPKSGLPGSVLEDAHKPLAYDIVSQKVKQLMTVNRNAKLYVTGHSLGGALAVLFTGMLFYNEEEMMTQRLAAVYTFGQPRVGDKVFASFMEKSLNEPIHRYFRVVYCNDIVSRVPFDNDTFEFKHFGLCFYFNCFYKLKAREREPNRNFSLFHSTMHHSIAMWDLLRSFTLGCRYGKAYKETLFCTLNRFFGFCFPGIAAHSMINYVNAIRLGPDLLILDTGGNNGSKIVTDTEVADKV